MTTCLIDSVCISKQMSLKRLNKYKDPFLSIQLCEKSILWNSFPNRERLLQNNEKKIHAIEQYVCMGDLIVHSCEFLEMLEFIEKMPYNPMLLYEVLYWVHLESI